MNVLYFMCSYICPRTRQQCAVGRQVLLFQGFSTSSATLTDGPLVASLKPLRESVAPPGGTLSWPHGEHGATGLPSWESNTHLLSVTSSDSRLKTRCRTVELAQMLRFQACSCKESIVFDCDCKGKEQGRKIITVLCLCRTSEQGENPGT